MVEKLHDGGSIMNPDSRESSDTEVVVRTSAPSPLWAITIGMAVFFAVMGALIAVG
jgi:hypothetical protein